MTKTSIFKYLLFVWMTSIICLEFLLPIEIRGLDGTTRTVFFHVSMAITATVAYIASAWFGLQYLRKRNMISDAKLQAAVELGFLFSVLSTVTGAIWARFTWGSFWHWDPRQTSSFILLLLYAALLMLRSTITDEEKAARLSSVYALFSFFPMIFLMFVLPRLLPGLHPGSDKDDVNPTISVTTDIEIRILLYLTWIGFIGLFFWIHRLKTQQLLVKKEII